MRIALFLLICLAPGPAATAATWYVDAGVSAGTNAGSSWSDAFSDLQTALAVADSLDEVWVAAGEYFPTAGGDRESSFLLPNGASVYGGFAGIESNRADRDWTSNLTVLSGNIGSTGSNADNSYHVVEPGAAATLDGFTVRDGYADGPSNALRRGAGIYGIYDGLRVRNCVITRNQTGSGGWGGGIYTTGDDILVEDCEISYNDATGSFSEGGGAAAAWGMTSTSVFRRVLFQNNTAGSNGGGLFWGSLADDCTFIGNSSVRNGGGSHWTDVVANCYYEGNSSLGGAGAGYGSLVRDSVFTLNNAGTGGGIYAATQVQRCVVYANTAENGGGVYLSVGQMHNSVLFDNTATNSGGGIFSCEGCANGNATNLTIVNNSAPVGGGIAGPFNMANSIVWGNQAPSAPNFYPGTFGAANLSYSLIEGSGGSGTGWLLGAIDGGQNIDADPEFVNSGASDFHLGSGSPALDAGSNASVVGDTDTEGNPRIQGGTVDIGAYEADAAVAAPEVRSRRIRGYPNPFNPRTTIELSFPSRTFATVTIYNVAGQTVRTLWNGEIAESAELSWDGKDESGRRVGTGVYFARVATPDFRESLKLMMVK